MQKMSDKEIIAFIEDETTCRLGLAVDDVPYVVPLAFVYMDGAIYVHLVGGHGKKAEWIEKNPEVCLEFDSYTKDHLVRQSVIITGRAERVTDKKLLVDFLTRLAKKYPNFSPGGIGRHPQVARPLLNISMPLMAKRITVYRVRPLETSGRQSDDRE